MNDLIKSIKADLYERAVSPLFGMFVVSWGLWNYKLVLVILSSMKIEAKLAFISNTLYPDFWPSLTQTAILPAVTTALFIFLYPYPAKFVYEHTRRKQKELKEIKQQIEDETPLTIEESREIRRELVSLELEYENELSRRKVEIDRLKEIIQGFESRPEVPQPKKEPIKRNEGKINKVTEEQLDLILLISKNQRMSEKSILEHAKTDPVRTEYNLGELLQMKYLNDMYPSGERAYEVTHAGRKLLVTAKLI